MAAGVLVRTLGVVVAGALSLGVLAAPATSAAPTATSAPSSAAAAVPAKRVGGYTPPAGALFNNPTGTPKERGRIIDHIINTIDSAPPRSVIRMAVFSFAHPRVADAIMRADQRGVRLRLVFSGDKVYPAMRRVRGALGSNPRARSYAVFCKDSCRAVGGQMHAKYFSFRRAGSAEFITMIGSVNLTRYNADRQWNDLYTVVGDKAYYSAYNQWFRQLRLDTPVATTYQVRSTTQADITFTPLDPAVTPDPIMVALDKIRCLVPMGEIDPGSPTPEVQVPTQVMLASHAWNGPRGLNLAVRVSQLALSGCQVRLFNGVGTGGGVASVLTNSGVAVNPGTHKGIRTHQKLMIVSGGFEAAPRTTKVWTGSSNWSSRALRRDDLIVQINDEAVAQQYAAAYDWMWANG